LEQTTTCSVNVTSTCSKWRYQRFEPRGGKITWRGPTGQRGGTQ